MARPETITESAQIAHDLILSRTDGDTVLADLVRRGIHDAYRTGANRALEAAALEIEAVDGIEWALAGTSAGIDAAALVRTRKLNPEKEN